MWCFRWSHGRRRRQASLGHREIAHHLHGGPISPARLRYEGGYQAVQTLLAQKGSKPTAICAPNDESAFGAVRACLDAGLRVPGDMAVAGTGDVEGTLHPAPFLTSVRWARAKLGRMAGEVMIRQLNKDPASLRAHVLKPELVIRQSTAPPLKA